MKTNAIVRTMDRLEDYSQVIFGCLAVLLFSVLSLWIVLFGAATLNGSSERDYRIKMDKLSVEVQTLEHEYISAKGNITMDLALSNGFVDNGKTNYVVVSPNSVNLSLNTQ